jgi:23S rRNA U2552 (ribose-2'-O)-methylase RlmE/FtsJ
MNSYSINETINSITEDNIDFLLDKPMYYYNVTLRNYIHNIKLEIDKLTEQWEKNKKYLNQYEFINTQFDSNTPSVCIYKPISRSFFKMIEMLNSFELNISKEKITSFHLAEGPGGFIEALAFMRKNKNDTYYGMTLMDESREVPKWTRCEQNLMKSNNIIIDSGIDGTGNLYHLDNLLYVRDKYAHSMDFITADGGFDYSLDFNSQEENSLNLIFAEICFAIIMQKKGGSFIIKMYDTFSSGSMELIYLLSYLYEEIIITKPSPSRPANSEKYFVCLKFQMKPNTDKIINKIIEKYQEIQKNKFTNILNIPLSNHFLDKMKEINSIFGQCQVENILSILTFIYDKNNNSERLEQLKKSHLNKCIKWCKKYNLPVNDAYNITL